MPVSNSNDALYVAVSLSGIALLVATFAIFNVFVKKRPRQGPAEQLAHHRSGMILPYAQTLPARISIVSYRGEFKVIGRGWATYQPNGSRKIHLDRQAPQLAEGQIVVKLEIEVGGHWCIAEYAVRPTVEAWQIRQKYRDRLLRMQLYVRRPRAPEESDVPSEPDFHVVPSLSVELTDTEGSS